jgi:Flp pilus assembly protein TadG
MLKPNLREVRGSQIVEFALVLPFLVVILVGIFDFGEAFNTKQKLHSAARETVRFTANLNSADLTQGASSTSVSAARMVAFDYLRNARLNPCGLDTATPAYDNYVWTYTTATGCPGSLVLIIERAVPLTTSEKTLIGSRVTIIYPFKWRFNTVVTLIAPKSQYPGAVFTMTTQAFMVNL